MLNKKFRTPGSWIEKRFTKKNVDRKLFWIIFKKRIGPKLATKLFELIAAATVRKKLKWKYGMADPSPLMTTVYAGCGKVNLIFRRIEDLAEENISYSLTLETMVDAERKSRKKEFYYPVSLVKKSTGHHYYKDLLIWIYIFIEESLRKK
ncbi:MAG: hypothetical protein M1334_00535 [Patescibacteria group bacterium]|nr:hypothetical protein [Patescibacteria group bacterium]